MWSAIEIVSSVDLRRYGNCSGKRGLRDDGVDVSHDQPFKAVHGYRGECYGGGSHCIEFDV